MLARRLLNFFDSTDKAKLAAISLMMVVAAGMEALGIGLVLPFIAILMNGEGSKDIAPGVGLPNIVGASRPDDMLIWLTGTMIVLYLAKNIYLGLVYFIQYRFVFRAQARVATKLLQAYAYAPYAEQINNNSALVVRNVLNEVPMLFNHVLLSVLVIATEGCVMLAIIGVLLYVARGPALITIVLLGAVTGIMYWVTRRKTRRLGRAQQAEAAEMTKWVQQTMGASKEIKMSAREPYFVSRFEAHARLFSDYYSFLMTLNQLPRLFIEGIAVSALLAIVIAALNTGTIQSVLPVLGVVAMAAMRLMPSLNRIVMSVSRIMYFKPALDVVERDLSDPSSGYGDLRPRDRLEFSGSIDLEGITFRYHQDRDEVLRNVDMFVAKGESVALTGESGAGKSTLADVIMGLLSPTAGRVLVDGIDIQTDMKAWQKNIGYIPQSVYLIDDTVRRNVALGVPDGEVSDREVWEALGAAQLKKFVEGTERGLDTEVGERGVSLSGGQRQRIAIARALYMDPSILVLDEATSALDDETENAVTTALSLLSGRKTMIVIAHRLSTLRLCDRVYRLEKGRVRECEKEDLLS